MGNRLRQGRSAELKVVFDPTKWVRALLVTVIGMVLMSALACAVVLARDTTGHDWYAAGKLTLTELLTELGFDDRAPVEYRTTDGAVVTLTRDGLMYNGDALLARDHLLRTAAKAAGLGAWCGLGGALLCLAISRRPKDERRLACVASGPEHLPGPEARARFAPPRARLEPVAPPPSAGSSPVRAPENRPSVSGASRSPGKEREARDTGKPHAGAENRQPDAAAPPPRTQRKRQYGRWI